MVYFKKNLCQTAQAIIEAKSTVDKIKAFDDIGQINYYFFLYNNRKWYNQFEARQLDERLRKEYKSINKINELPSPHRNQAEQSRQTTVTDSVISGLKQDYYGILFEVLVKEGLVQELKDFIDRIE